MHRERGNGFGRLPGHRPLPHWPPILPQTPPLFLDKRGQLPIIQLQHWISKIHQGLLGSQQSSQLALNFSEVHAFELGQTPWEVFGSKSYTRRDYVGMSSKRAGL